MRLRWLIAIESVLLGLLALAVMAAAPVQKVADSTPATVPESAPNVTAASAESLASQRPELVVQTYGGTDYSAVTADGRTAVTTRGSENEIVVWDLVVGGKLRTFPLVPDEYHSPGALSATGVLAIPRTSYKDLIGRPEPEIANKSIELFDARSGRLLRTLRLDEKVLGLAFSGDGRRLAVRGYGAVHLYDTATGAPSYTLTADSFSTLRGNDSLAFSRDGRRLAVTRNDGIQIYDTSTGERLHTLKIDGHVCALDYSDDARYIAVAWIAAVAMGQSPPPDRTVEVVDTANWEAVWRRKQEVLAPDTFLEFSPDSSRLAVGSYSFVESSVQVWDFKSDKVLISLSWPEKDTVYVGPALSGSVSFSPGGTLLAVGGREGCVVTVATGEVLRKVRSSTAVFASSGKLFVTGWLTPDGVWLEDSFTGERIAELAKPDGLGLVCFQFSPDARRLYVSDLRITCIWDFRGGNPPVVIDHALAPQNAAVWSPDGRSLASGGLGVYLFDPDTRETREMPGSLFDCASLAFNGDGTVLAGAGSDWTVKLWDPAAGVLKRTLEPGVGFEFGPGDAPDQVTFDTDGSVWAHNETKSARWDASGNWSPIRSGEPVPKTIYLDHGQSRVVRAYDRDHESWLLGGVWYPVFRDTGARVPAPAGESFRVDMDCTPDGALVAVKRGANAVRVYNRATNRLLATLYLFSQPEGSVKDGDFDWLAVTPEGYYDGSAGAERYAKWRLHPDVLVPLGDYRSVFYRPDIVRRSLRGETAIAGLPSMGRLTPRVELAWERQSDGRIQLEVAAIPRSELQIRSVEITANGVPVPVDRLEQVDLPRSIKLTERVPGTKIALATIAVNPSVPSVDIVATALDEKGQRGIARVLLTTEGEKLVETSRYRSAPSADLPPLPIAGKVHVFSVGVNTVKKTERLNLPLADKGAEDVAAAFHSTLSMCGLKVNNLPPLVDAAATTDRILAGLDALAGQVAHGDLVILYLGCHGFQVDFGEAYYLMTYLGDMEALRDTALQWKDLKAKLLGMHNRGAQVLLLLDACHAGAANLDMAADNKVLAMDLDSIGVAVLAAASEQEVSLQPSDGLSYFVKAVKQVLESYGSGSKTLTVERFAQEVRALVSAEVRKSRGESQTPMLVTPEQTEAIKRLILVKCAD